MAERNWFQKIITGNIEVRDVIFFVGSLVLASLLLWLGYEILYGVQVAFTDMGTYGEWIGDYGAVSIFDKVTMFSNIQWGIMIVPVMEGYMEFIGAMIGQWIIIWLVLGIFMALSGLGHRSRVAYNMFFVFLIIQLIAIWTSPLFAGVIDPEFGGSIQSSASIMLLINFAMVFLFALLFNKLLSGTIFKGLREFENVNNA